jgi:hypothetical protein
MTDPVVVGPGDPEAARRRAITAQMAVAHVALLATAPQVQPVFEIRAPPVAPAFPDPLPVIRRGNPGDWNQPGNLKHRRGR